MRKYASKIFRRACAYLVAIHTNLFASSQHVKSCGYVLTLYDENSEL